MAAKLVEDGRVRVNGVRSENAAKRVGPGDVLTIAAPHTTAVVQVRDAGERRGPAPEARLLYHEVGRDDGALVTDPADG